MKIKYLLVFFLFLSCSSDDPIIENPPINTEESLYFPPISSSSWETTTPSSLNWDETKLQELYLYLDTKNTKGFIILVNGKIVVEKYFNNHSQNATWPWFSAVKSLTATAIGIAQDEGIININNKTSDYLGNNWSSLTQEKQDLITVKHHLSMTTGLISDQNNLIAWTCTQPICIQYEADAGTQWNYHQGAFTQLQNMLSLNTGVNFKTYIETKILDKIGAAGSWSNLLAANIFSSNTRTMARFGLLSLNKGNWDETQIVSESYFNEMTNTSQDLNESYGYLWWLNGKESFLGTDSTLTSGSIVPNGPSDGFGALGANDQKIYVATNLNMVVVRSGESAGNGQLSNSSFDNELWGKINEVMN